MKKNIILKLFLLSFFILSAKTHFPSNIEVYGEEFSHIKLDTKNTSNDALSWSNKHFPNIYNENIDHIRHINSHLRTKYLNKSEFYQPYTDLEIIDDNFNTETTEEIISHANFTPEEFGINSQYFIDYTEKVYTHMLKNSLFGIDHGYFLSDLTTRELDNSKNEHSQINLTIPEGTYLIRVGSLANTQYILPRESTFSYVTKYFDKENKNIYISGKLVNKSELNQSAITQSTLINNQLSTLYGVSHPLVTLLPLGLNAGYTLTEGYNVILKSFELLHSGGILSRNLFSKESFCLTNGLVVHTDVFDFNLCLPTEIEKRKA